jgi:hypothetical protein
VSGPPSQSQRLLHPLAPLRSRRIRLSIPPSPDSATHCQFSLLQARHVLPCTCNVSDSNARDRTWHSRSSLNSVHPCRSMVSLQLVFVCTALRCPLPTSCNHAQYQSRAMLVLTNYSYTGSSIIICNIQEEQNNLTFLIFFPLSKIPILMGVVIPSRINTIGTRQLIHSARSEYSLIISYQMTT